MRITYVPIRVDQLQYKIDGEVIFIKLLDGVKKVDFSSVLNGRLESSISFISKAQRVEGELKVTLYQPIDRNGDPIDQNDDFDTDEFTDIAFEWKTQQEIDDEKNAPKPPTTAERLEAAEQAIIMLMMED